MCGIVPPRRMVYLSGRARATTAFVIDAGVEFGDQQVLALFMLLAPRDIVGPALKALLRVAA